MRKKSVFILVAFLLFCVACEKNLIVEIDNPSDEEIQFKIDEKAYKIKPRHLGRYTIKSGEHQLVIGGKYYQIYFDKKKNYMLNPTKSKYVLLSISYTHEDYSFRKNISDRHKHLYYDTLYVELDSVNVPISGMFKIVESLNIEKSWDYGFEDKLPKYISSERILGESRKKIFREEDFILYYLKQNKMSMTDFKKMFTGLSQDQVDLLMKLSDSR